MSTSFYRPLFRRIFNLGWAAGLFFILLWSVPRFWLVMWAVRNSSYQYVSLLFISMWLAPFVLLSRAGRKAIGIKRPANYFFGFTGFLVGLLYCGLLFGLAFSIYGLTESNWLVYTSRTYSNLPGDMTAGTRFLFFLIFSGISMTFSPIGEELLYRGLIHENFRHSFGQRAASWLDSLAFSMVHLAHFGLIWKGGGWAFLWWPALFWIAGLFGLCLLFSYFRERSGSILGAILAHAGFNLGMNYFIFYQIL